MIKVSFIVAIYNVGKYLPRCIESIVSQQMNNIEILLVNDGSTDDGLAICNSYAERDSRIKVIDQENSGANAARNKGLQLAQGEWVYFVDGDDFVDPAVCTAIEQYLDGNFDIVMFSYARYVDQQVKQLWDSKDGIVFHKGDFKELQLSDLNRLGNYRYNFKIFDPATLCNKMYRRSFLMKNHLSFIPGFPKLQDMTFNLMVYDYAQSAIYIPHVGYYYQYNDQSVTNRYQQDMIHKFDVINRWLGQFIAGRKEDERYVRAYRERIATNMRTCVVRCICHPKNESSYRERRAQFLRLRNTEPYRIALDRTGIRAFYGYKERILAFAVKYRLFGVCEFLCVMFDKMQAKHS